MQPQTAEAPQVADAADAAEAAETAFARMVHGGGYSWRGGWSGCDEIFSGGPDNVEITITPACLESKVARGCPWPGNTVLNMLKTDTVVRVEPDGSEVLEDENVIVRVPPSAVRPLQERGPRRRVRTRRAIRCA
jgi:hypothetical protein